MNFWIISFDSNVLSEQKCDIAETVEMQVCQRPFCEKCANFENPCAGANEECVDINDSKTCLCKKPFSRDDFGECNKCNALRPFSWQCDTGESLILIIL